MGTQGGILLLRCLEYFPVFFMGESRGWGFPKERGRVREWPAGHLDVSEGTMVSELDRAPRWCLELEV